MQCNAKTFRHGGGTHQEPFLKSYDIVAPAKSCRYNVSGFVEELSPLPENREGHACAVRPDIPGVSPVPPSSLPSASVFMTVVAPMVYYG